MEYRPVIFKLRAHSMVNVSLVIENYYARLLLHAITKWIQISINSRFRFTFHRIERIRMRKYVWRNHCELVNYIVDRQRPKALWLISPWAMSSVWLGRFWINSKLMHESWVRWHRSGPLFIVPAFATVNVNNDYTSEHKGLIYHFQCNLRRSFPLDQLLWI